MSELKGNHVLALLLGFFGVTIAVNAVFVTYALQTFSGEDKPRPYLQGLAYNKTLAEHADQAKLGWTATIDTGLSARDGITKVRIVDRNGVPQDGLTVVVTFRRPTDAAFDRSISLSAIGAGKYEGTAQDLAAGQWDLVARTTAPNGVRFEAMRRVLVK